MNGRSGFAKAAALWTLLLLGCADTAPPLVVPELDPAQSGRQAMLQYDANSDGAISGTELERCPGLKATLAQVDRDQDGRVTADEIATRLSNYLEEQVALTNVSCRVLLDSQPLADATVTLVPERFMGPNVKPARGVSNAEGYVSLRVDGEDVPGSHCGIFRIEVSKKDASGKELLPAKYNAQTMLGQDIGAQGAVGEGGMVFNLSRR